MLYVGFEPTITASVRAKRVHALDRLATVTDKISNYIILYSINVPIRWPRVEHKFAYLLVQKTN
jgi:hypothetical protein